MNNIRILVIDDETSNIQFIINILQNSANNFIVLSSNSSVLGLEIAIETKPDIIITDWQMPELNGIELILKLKQHEVTKEIPVIMATGVNLSTADLKYALDSGAFDFIRKPIDAVVLLARLNSAIRMVDYYTEKAKTEALLNKIQIDNLLNDIENKKKELLSKTIMLTKINQLCEGFQSSLMNVQCVHTKNDCNLYCHAQKLTSDIIKSGSKSIWNELELNFEQTNETFYKNLSLQFPNLTANERKLCTYLRLNLSTKEISTITTQTIRSIEIARTRLREKLGLKDSTVELNHFMLQF